MSACLPVIELASPLEFRGHAFPPDEGRPSESRRDDSRVGLSISARTGSDRVVRIFYRADVVASDFRLSAADCTINMRASAS